MKKRFVGLSLVLLLTFASSITAGAEELKGEAGWQVTFNGKRMESNFTSAGMADGINAMQPGDSVELTITLKNDFDGQADWYMKNEVLEALEDAGDAEGGAYDYLLTYTDVTNTVTTLYSSEKFGGEGRYNGVGLHGATTTLDDFFYLDRMGEGDTGVVKLMVALDGGNIIGAGSVRNGNHLSLLFVDEAYHCRGVGSMILGKLCDFLRTEAGERYMSLQAAPCAVNFYRKQGFRAVRPEMEFSGIRVTPMEKVF